MRSFTKTVTEKQLAANLANGQKPHGPVTPEGREKSSQNRLWHGLAGRFRVIETEDQNAFDHLFNSFVRDENPIGSVELELVRKMAEYTWLRQRSTRFLESMFLVAPRTPEQIDVEKVDIRVNPAMERFLRYQAHYDRLYAKASAELLKRQKQRYLLQSGFESQKRAQAAENRAEKRQSYRDKAQYLMTKAKELDIQLKETRLQAALAPRNRQQAA